MDELNIEDLIVEEDMVVTVSHRGYIKRNPLSLYRSQRRGGKGRTGMVTREEDFVANLFVASTHDNLLFFSNKGKVYRLKVHELPQAGRAAKGKAVVNLLPLEKDEVINELLATREFEPGKFIVMATQKGVIKKTELIAFKNIRATGIIAINLDESDQLIDARITNGDGEIFLSSHDGKSIRFKESEVRPMGRATRGVKGMELEEGDKVVGMEILSEGNTILTASQFGYGKRSPLDDYRLQSRGGKGVLTMRTSDRNGKVIGVMQVHDDDQVMIITDGGKIIRLKVKDIRVIGRVTQGVKLIELSEGEQVTGIVKLAEREDDEDGDENGTGKQEPAGAQPEEQNESTDE